MPLTSPIQSATPSDGFGLLSSPIEHPTSPISRHDNSVDNESVLLEASDDQPMIAAPDEIVTEPPTIAPVSHAVDDSHMTYSASEPISEELCSQTPVILVPSTQEPEVEESGTDMSMHPPPIESNTTSENVANTTSENVAHVGDSATEVRD